ncbi:MAG: HNH endonuclease [Candidatus Viridilinea halotolerans]|uniref:HNH endonuclease n=1 Tax=Candidatus Viridilinea halotolerans TaxID=2491704 RepID=A0A426U0S0_9CHLR|nr:MAG: HNH endonuclease [Candidatus Viridilinea halotolerans]
MLEKYKTTFAKLRIDRVPSRWDEATNGGAPHKALLLLSVLDLVAQGEINAPLVVLHADLIDLFDRYWRTVMGSERKGNIALPFYHLKSDGFWHLVAVPGQEQALHAQIRSLKTLEESVLGAELDAELFALLLVPHARDDLRRVLVETYFAPHVRAALVEVGVITAHSFEYSRSLIKRAREPFTLKETPDLAEQYATESRSTGFRRTVVAAYQHTCAVCKIRIVTPEGRTAVSAAHIVPWSVSHNDDPRNGMALCGLHHWAFDEGLIGINPATYQIIISPVVDPDEQATEPLRRLHDAALHLPEAPILHPAPSALQWHQREVFRNIALRRIV